MNLYIFYLAVILALITATSVFGDVSYPVAQISPGVFYHQGAHQEPSADNIGAIANVGFIVGKRCVAVIDTGGSYQEGVKLRKAIKAQTDLPICYVINTHAHPDHIFGNAAFKADNPQYISHTNMPKAMAARQVFFARTFKQILGKAYEGTEFIGPKRLVNVGMPLTLDLGNRPITLTAYPTSHTDNDLTVFDNTTKTLWTGDLLFINRVPVMDGNINGWIKTIQQLQTMNINTVIPGHGKASSDKWQQDFAKQLYYLNLLRDEIRAIIADFGTITEATQQVGQSEKDKWELFAAYHSRNITAIFAQLEWE